jgi:hypothetical protein
VPADTDDHPAVAEEPREAVIEDRAVPTEGDDHRGGMAVSRFGVGTGVRDRALIGEGDRFPEGTAVWFWTLVEGGSRGDSIDHVWLHDGVEVQRVRLKVDASSWRTQSHKSLSDCRGAWTVEARDAAGGVLARSAFSCSA